MFDLTSQFSPLADAGDPPYFHKNPPHINFDFDQGTPDPATFPTEDLTRLAARVIAEDGPECLNYMDPRYGYGDIAMGWSPLREQIANLLEERDGQRPDHDGIIVTGGSVQGIALAGNAFLSAGDAAFVEAATFPFALRYFAQTGATVLPVTVDEQGMDVDRLADAIEQAARDGLRPKMVYTIPTFQLPTGTELSLERRHALLALADTHDLVILEDNIYAALRYEGEPLPTLRSLDTEGHVLQSDSFAKTVAPGTRLGWVTGPKDGILGLAKVRQDLGANQWISKIMTRYLAEGLLPPQVARAVDRYRPKRDVTADALTEHCGRWVSYRLPHGGFYFWLELADGLDWEQVARQMFDRGIAMRPGEMFMGQTAGRSHLRMAFAHMPEDSIRKGLMEFGAVLDTSAKPS
ncbi:MAG TPA: PLP-dependent aminotransferase family protein [Amycolatopsis sp.]|nr:PLP-dependent aminotransferase family protein [Amycolatopsis sp.]